MPGNVTEHPIAQMDLMNWIVVRINKCTLHGKQDYLKQDAYGILNTSRTIRYRYNDIMIVINSMNLWMSKFPLTMGFFSSKICNSTSTSFFYICKTFDYSIYSLNVEIEENGECFLHKYQLISKENSPQ